MKHVSMYELHVMYDELLDEVYGLVNIAGYEYSAARALREVDPIAYNMGFADWLDTQVRSGLIKEDSHNKHYLTQE